GHAPGVRRRDQCSGLHAHTPHVSGAMLTSLAPPGPGESPHWERLAAWLREQVPVDGVDGVWVFRVLRRDQREFGTAVLSRIDGGRRRIYTATYVAQVKGKQRGSFEPHLDEVGSGPLEALQELLALGPVRADNEEPPTPVDVALWFPPVPIGAAADD